MEKIAVDYAIMEKAKNVVVANGDFDWDDVGDWPAIGRHYAKDSGGNVSRGEFVEIDSTDCIVLSDQKHLVATVGVKDLVIVHTEDATLICHKIHCAQKVREVVKKLAAEKKYKRLLWMKCVFSVLISVISGLGWRSAMKTGTIASPLTYIDGGGIAAVSREIVKLCTERQAGKIVVGIPLRLDGTRSEQTERTLAFIAELQGAATIPVVKWDERLDERAGQSRIAGREHAAQRPQAEDRQSRRATDVAAELSRCDKPPSHRRSDTLS